MFTIYHEEKLHPLELETVKISLARQGIEYATISPGNRSIMVAYGRLCCYYIFHDHRLIDVQID